MQAAMPRRFAGTKSASRQHIGGRFDLRSALFTTALGTGVLATASLWSADAARAGCVEYDASVTPNTVLCDTARTTADGSIASSGAVVSDLRHQWFNTPFADPDDIVVTITTDGDIDGFGLAVSTTAPGAAITVDHQGAISVDAGNTPAFGGAGVFNLTTNGGNITYTGNGSVIDNDGGNPGLVIDTGAGAGNIAIGTAVSPVVPNYQGTTALRTNSGTGNQDIFLDGGSLVATDNLGAGLYATSTTGDIAIELTGNTAITTTVAAPNGATGVRADSAGGSVTISSDADIGSAGFEFARGISSTSSAGTAIDITQTGGTILATDFGIYAETSGANTGISVTTDAGSLIDMLGGTGIFANQLGTTGGVTVTVDGDITGADIGVDAAIANALNADDVTVTVSGGVHAVTGGSIRATTIGTGNANVILVSGADLQGGVLAESVTGNAGIVAGDNVTVVGNSPGAASITAGGDATQVWGDNAAVSGSSGLVVDQTSPAGAGVATVLVGADGTIVGDGTDLTDDYNGNGIFAGNQGTGLTSVTTGTGTSVTGEANGIVAFQTNAANTSDITIDVDGPVTGNGTVPFVLAPYTDAFVAAALPTTGLGIGVSNAGTGDILVTAGDTVTGDTVGIQTLASGGGNTEITTGGAVTGGVDGIHAAATGAGAITILANGTVDGTAGDGIVTSAVNGNTDITTGAAVTGGVDGIDATATGIGDITVTTNAAVTGVVDGIVTSANDGNTTISAVGTVIGGNDGIHAEATDGSITITTSDTVDGGVDGIDATATDDGAITVTTNGAVEGSAGDGIVTLAENGNTTIIANDDVTGGIDGVDATATGTGDIDISVAAGATVTGTTGSGVVTTTAAGTAAIDNAGLIEGAFAAISGATGTVLEIVNQTGGLIQNLSASLGDLAISVTGAGVADIDNGGTIVGRITTDAGNDTFTNSGLWATTGLSDFGAGNDSLTNTGRITVAEEAALAEITHFTNLESFTNASTGIIDMVDGALGDPAAGNAPGVRDTLTIDGAYTGVAGSLIELDLALVAGYNPQTSSDLLILDPANPATGTTDFLFNIVSTGVTATTADTGRVGFAGGQLLAAPVTVVENRGALSTSSGDAVIPLARSGLIAYDLVSTAPAGGDYQVVSQLDAGLAGGILLPIPATLATVAFTTQRTPNPITATCIDPANKSNAQGGWVRGFAGQFDTENKGTAVVDGTTTRLESENLTRFRTIQGGFDHVMCNLDAAGSTLHLGVTVGQTWGESRQTDPDPLTGIFGTDVDFDTFFVGPYAAFTRGPLAVQAAIRFDHHSLELTNPTAGVDADGLDIDADGLSGSTSVSYDFELKDLTLTPDIGINVSNTETDKFEIAGATVVLDDLWSVMGHVGVTARTTLAVADNVFVVPFASATLYHEFVEQADGKLTIGKTTAEVESNRIGTFGQLGVGANAVRLGDVVAGRPTLFGGARFDLQVGERIEGATATVFGRVQF